MFPLNWSCELSFQIANTAAHQQEHEEEDMLILLANINATVLETGIDQSSNNNILGKGRRCERGKESLLGDTNVDSNEEHKSKKKMIHRDLERQRRPEMAQLYSSLRSLVLIEGIKSFAAGHHIAANVRSKQSNGCPEALKVCIDLRSCCDEKRDGVIPSRSGSDSLLHCNQIAKDEIIPIFP
ncbi:hypothetical protein Ancab_010164 [Ancistrocladus abbreviatus]